MNSSIYPHVQINLNPSSINKNNKKIYFKESWKIISAAIIFVILLCALFWANIFLLTQKPLSLKEFITIIIFSTKKSNIDNSQIVDSLEIIPVQRSLWICLSSIIAAIALIIGCSWIQSLTQNPLADVSTLGFMNSSILGIIIMKGIISNSIESYNYHVLYFIFSIIGGIFTIFILSFLFLKPQNKQQHLKIILIGLVLNIIFNTFTFLIKTYNSNAVNAAFALAMGGAENVYGLYTQQFLCLKWCAIAVLILFVISFIFSPKLNIYELGEDKAKVLGINIKTFKFLTYIITCISTAISIILVGNVAFLGLVCTHAIRIFIKTRKYHIILPLGALLSCILLLGGTMINSFLPFISSSIFTTLLGGIVLLSFTLKNRSL